MREEDARPSSAPRGSSWLVHQHIGTSHDETIPVLLLQHMGNVEKSWDLVGDQGQRGGYVPNCLWDRREHLELFLVIQVSNFLALWPALPAVVLISRFPSDARRHALCMAAKTLTLLLLITEKLQVTGPDCAAGDVCGALTPRAEFSQ